MHHPIQPDISVVIVSWNTKALLQACLESVFAQTKKYTLEVWVVDNNSPDQSAEMVTALFPNVKVIANTDNVGFAPANNQAMALATGRYILLLNPDTIIINGAIDAMATYLDTHTADNLGILTCKLLNEDLTLQKSVNGFYGFWKSFIENRFFADMLKNTSFAGKLFTSYWAHDYNREIDWAYGAVMMFSKQNMSSIGMLDPRFFIYAEEIDLYIRYRNAGKLNYFLADVAIIHIGKSSSRQRRSAMFIQNYKSFYLLLRKHYGTIGYYAYRYRALIYLNIWYKRFSKGTSAEDIQQAQVYKETIAWHKTPESRITL